MLEPFDQLEPAPAPKPAMPLGKVVLINFGIMLAYMVFISLTTTKGSSDRELGLSVGNAFLLTAQVGINLLAGLILVFSEQRRHIGSALLIGGLITAVIGFGTCLAAIGLTG